MRRFLINTTTILFSLFLTGCWLAKKERDDKESTEHLPPNPVLQSSSGVIITRSTNRKSVEVKFQALRRAECTISFWSQSAKPPYNKANPGTHLCSENPEGRKFAEVIEKLDSKDIYFFHIEVRAPGKIERLLVREESDGITVFRPNPEGPVLGQNLILAKVDIPTGVIAVSGVASSEPLDLAKVNAKLTRPQGCQIDPRPSQLKPLESEVFRQNNPGLEALTTRGFATGEAAPWLNREGVLRLEVIDQFQWGNTWEWIYKKRGIEETFQTASAPVVRRLQVSKPLPVEITGQAIEGRSQELNFEQASELEFSWEILGSGPHSYVSVSLISKDKEKYLHCIFPTRSPKGIIDSSDLAKLGGGTFDLIMALEDSRIHGYQVKSKHGWIIKVTDWRHAFVKL